MAKRLMVNRHMGKCHMANWFVWSTDYGGLAYGLMENGERKSYHIFRLCQDDNKQIEGGLFVCLFVQMLAGCIFFNCQKFWFGYRKTLKSQLLDKILKFWFVMDMVKKI